MNRDHLLAALELYSAADPAEADSLERIKRFVASAADPFGRGNPEGHVTGSAVVARPDGSAFLLVHHRKLGRWLQPGGHAEESDESAFHTALREAREETGIAEFQTPLARAILDVDVHAIPAHRKDPVHFHFDIRYLLASSAPMDPSNAEDPARPMVWLSLPEALAAGMDGSLLRALRKASATLLDREPVGGGMPRPYPSIRS